MKKPKNTLSVIVIAFLFLACHGYAQLSPGDLSEAHAHLEGMSNCTECHTLGEKVANNNCLACHTHLKKRIDEDKGYHASKAILGKDCVSCHSDHHGRKFEMIRFDKNSFDHRLTGYELEGAHQKQDCNGCHKKDFIINPDIKKKKKTFLGLGTDCLACHEDQHQKSLSSDCISCHDFTAFKPVSKFNHNNAKFRLLGKHQEVDCNKCHKSTTVNGKAFQQFTGLKFESCTDCHKDVHLNKFGQNCIQCHSEQSFHIIKGMSSFDHSRTRFQLVDKHQTVACKDCHKTKLTDPIKHSRCADCHLDYHQGQFMTTSTQSDCSDCHSTRGFVGSSFTIERHKESEFPLQGAHMATPCFVCHKKENKWKFRAIGLKCIDCHNNIHEAQIDEKYYPEARCENCHSQERWADIAFQHKLTEYELLGAHEKLNCRDCHFKSKAEGGYVQRFSQLTSNCLDCHQAVHNKQFEVDGKTDCLRCHDHANWKIAIFDHNTTRFPLDGKHQGVSCAECHKEKIVEQTKFIQYKFNEIRCENCH